MNPTVSICIPTYNGERYLAECLNSVAAQTCADVEVLLVDDCSSDATLDIANEYASHDSRVRILRNETNLGLVGNWNRCVKLAKGEWIKFVFQDDLIAPTCIERMLKAAGADGSFVFCRRDFIFEEGTTPSTRETYLIGTSLVESAFPDSNPVTARQFSELALRHMGRNFIGEPTAVLLRRRVFDTFGEFNPHLAVSCDTEYWLRVGVHTGAIPVPEVLASFRVHGESVSARSLLKSDYRINVLDGLAMLHEAAFNPRYAPLRDVATDSSVDLAAQFRAKALWAYGVASRAARDATHPDDSLLKEWRQVAGQFKHMASVPLRYGILRRWGSFIGKCRWLLGLETAGR